MFAPARQHRFPRAASLDFLDFVPQFRQTSYQHESVEGSKGSQIWFNPDGPNRVAFNTELKEFARLYKTVWFDPVLPASWANYVVAHGNGNAVTTVVRIRIPSPVRRPTPLRFRIATTYLHAGSPQAGASLQKSDFGHYPERPLVDPLPCSLDAE